MGQSWNSTSVLFHRIKEFYKITFVPQYESDAGLFMRIDRDIAKSLFPILFAHLLASFHIRKVVGTQLVKLFLFLFDIRIAAIL